MLDLLEAKKVHKRLYCLNLPELQIYFRLPSWKEYQTYISILEMGLLEPVYLYDQIFQSIVLDEQIKTIMFQLPAGIVDAVVTIALKMAGNPLRSEDDLVSLNQDIDMMRGFIQNNVYEQFVSIICRVFPAYSPSEVENLSWPEILKLLLMAEKVLVEEGRIEGGVNVKPLEKPKGLVDQISEDMKRFRDVDNAPPPMQDLRERNQEAMNSHPTGKRELTPQQVAQVERANKAKERMQASKQLPQSSRRR